MSTILVVDDDGNIRSVVQYALEKAGFSVRLATHGQEGIEVLGEGGVDLVVLDILMPEMDGLAFLRQVRSQSDVPVVFLTSVDDELDRIVGLELGADDYVTKPFSPRELVARVKSVLRRSAVPLSQPKLGSLCHGPVRLDLSETRVFCRDVEIPLTPMEFNLMHRLLSQPGKVFSRDELMAFCQGHIVSDRAIDTHVKRIRQKFAAHRIDPIETLFGFGYRAARREI